MNVAHVFYSQLGTKIKKRREGLGLTQEALASLIDLSRTSVTNIEKGRQKLLLHTFIDIASALRVLPAALLPDAVPIVGEDVEELLKDRPSKERDWIASTVKAARMGAKQHGR
jgi:transcriptional regulator with XRE-family HTH domain